MKMGEISSFKHIGLRFIIDRRERRILQYNCRSLQLCPLHFCSVIISRSCEDQFGRLFGVLKVADNEFHDRPR